MALEWPDRPDTCEVVDVVKETTAAGGPCQIHLNLDYKKGGVSTGERGLVVNPGYLREHGVPDPIATFAEIFALIPDTAQSVKDAIRGKLTDKMVKEAYLGRRLED